MLIAVIAVLTVYVLIRTFVTLDSESTEPSREEEEQTLTYRVSRSWPRIRYVLTFVILILVLASLILAVVRNRTAPDSQQKITLRVNEFGDFGDLNITVDNITPLDNSAYGIQATIRSKNGRESTPIEGGVGSEFNLSDNRYHMKILSVGERVVTISIRKN